MFHWLPHSDDVTRRDVIIVLINAVTRREELQLTVENLRTPYAIWGGGGVKGGAIANLNLVLKEVRRTTDLDKVRWPRALSRGH